ncbi:MAG: hypothetical protein N3G21_04670 [Candidatus Hydrogenedentes bacterium]|nr:hypothetical protein [Candidatus Hydrogenedentota bacterium]
MKRDITLFIVLLMAYSIGLDYHLCAQVSECLKEVDELPVLNEVPSPFKTCSGEVIKTKNDWLKRREEIKQILMFYEYGHMPPAPPISSVRLIKEADILESRGICKEFKVIYGPPEFEIDIMLFLPKDGFPPYPTILYIPKFWKENDDNLRIAEKCIKKNYVLCVFDKSMLDDDSGSRDQKIYRIYPGYDWGSLAVWGWGALRVLDFLETLPDVDTKHLALTGHSRRGKASLWASANDERIPLVIPQSSGTGGCGSYWIVGDGAETLKAITTDVAPYWFVPRLKSFVGKENRLPFDQHFLKALIAPRGQLSRESLGDLWANPKGTQAMHLYTVPVYELLNAENNIYIHFREGGHALQDTDWDLVLEFCDFYFFKKKPPSGLNSLPFSDIPTPSWMCQSN